MRWLIQWIIDIFLDLLFLLGILFFIEGIVKDSAPGWVFVAGFVAASTGLEFIIYRKIEDKKEEILEEVYAQMKVRIKEEIIETKQL